MTRATQDRNATVQALKLLFLLCICYGHIFAEGPGASLMHTLPMRLWWAPGDVGLFFFTATSGYFTTLRYPSPDKMGGYWTRKVSRLFGLFLFLNAVLGCVFLVTGRTGLFSLDTLFNLAGLNGFLNWFHLGNESPFGAGQWFMTLLLLFYLVYPWLSRAATSPARGRLLLWGGIMLAAAMQVVAPYGHSLWSTAVGFLAGFWLARFGGGNAGRTALFAAAACVVAAAAYSVSGHLPVAAYSIIGLAGYAVTAFALTGFHPLLPPRLVAACGDLLLPLYIIHTYFRLPLADNPYLDSLLALGMNVCIAWVLQRAYCGLVRLTERMAGQPDAVRGGAA